MIKVLVASPTDPEIPGNLKYLLGGENTYTRTLLGNPPKGVEFIHFEQALKNGSIEYLPIQKLLSLLVKVRLLPTSSGSQCFRIRGVFDLIHCHGYSIKISGSNVPIVLSDSSSNFLFLRDYINWPLWRIKLGYFVRKILFKRLGVIDADTNLVGAKSLIVFSNFARSVHINLGEESKKIKVIYPGIANMGKLVRVPNHKDVNILFVGTWFERKGGRLLLDAFDKLSNNYSNLKLKIVGLVPENIKLGTFVEQIDFVPRERLMRTYFPWADIFVLVPPKVEGFGLSVIEAMSFGAVPIVSDVCALSELVENGKTGFVVKPGSLKDLVEKLEVLIENPNLRKQMGKAAKEKQKIEFSINMMNKKLFKVYREALVGWIRCF